MFQSILSWCRLAWAWLLDGFFPTPDECRERGFAHALNRLSEGASIAELEIEIEADETFGCSEVAQSFNFGIREGIQHWKDTRLTAVYGDAL